MDSVKNYKCPCCSAPLAFDAGKQSLRCSSCENDFTLDTLEQLDDAQQSATADSKYDWSTYVPRKFENTNEDFSDYSCPGCGAEIMGDANLGATVCPYCGNATIVKGQFEGALKPDYIIPFKYDKKAAVEAFEADFKNAPFLPDDFKNKKRYDEISGVYVPFWMFDCNCDAAIVYRAETVSTWTTSDYVYTKTNHYRLFRRGKIGYANIPADASKKADDTYMEAVEPYNYSEAVNFDSAYLSGFLADKYDVSSDECIGRANERVKISTEDAFTSTTVGYEAVRTESSRIEFSDGKIRYSLLPVWMLNIKYLDKIYRFAINGQTGKVVGEYPVDKKKKWWYFAKVALISAAVAGGLLYLYNM